LKRIMGDVKIILDDVSEHYRDLTFHLRQETIIYHFGRKRPFLQKYIEVSIANVQGFVASPCEESTADMLVDLEPLKGILISEEEHNEKRKDILDSV
jgi:hypothetical protein